MFCFLGDYSLRARENRIAQRSNGEAISRATVKSLLTEIFSATGRSTMSACTRESGS